MANIKDLKNFLDNRGNFQKINHWNLNLSKKLLKIRVEIGKKKLQEILQKTEK